MITKQKLIDNGISENCISKERCNKCTGILVGQKHHNKIALVCVDCATIYESKEAN